MKRPNKTMRRRKQRRQRSRRHSSRTHTRRHKYRGGGLPVPAGAVVAISTGGEYGVPILMSKEKAEAEKDAGSLEE